MSEKVKNVIITGAAGRDFHDFLVYFKNNPNYNVVAFTAEQIPVIDKRRFPKELAGPRYPKGIPIFPEKDLTKLIKKFNIDLVTLNHSDLSHTRVMHEASVVLSAGANYMMLSYEQTSLKSIKPVISVTAVRTGCGKSQVSRKICRIVKASGKRIVLIRHPMPYGDLNKQRVQRFEKYEDLDKHKCTIEEREEYEFPIKNGIIVYAGVDYEAILRMAEKEADIILWDGGNNDVPFYKSDLKFVVLDPFRAGHEISYHPGEENFRLADVFILNKMDSAPKEGINTILTNIKNLENETKKKRILIKANSEIKQQINHNNTNINKNINGEIDIRGKRVLVVEDGPTLTHGGMSIGAGEVYAKRQGAIIVDPRKYAVGSLKEVYKKFTQLSNVLPAMGYSKKQIKELEKTVNRVPCDYILDGSPFDISRLIKVKKPVINLGYELDEIGMPDLKSILKKYKFI